MRGDGHHPLGWAATLLIAVAYAHVLLELAAAVVAVAVVVRLLTSPVRDELGGRRRCRLLERSRDEVVPVRRGENRTAGAASADLNLNAPMSVLGTRAEGRARPSSTPTTTTTTNQ